MTFLAHRLKRLLPAALAALALFAGAMPTRAASPLDSDLSAERIVLRADGREVQQPAQAVKPGDTVQYRARYRNSGAAALSNVVATLPIPPGTQFVSTNTQPDGAQASVDGVSFDAMPLTRRVRKADGHWETIQVPLAEYRALRWPARTLSAGEAFDVSLRVQVIDAAAAGKKVAP